jgi:DNA invertase Pin-like site-specific DNA recombinase
MDAKALVDHFGGIKETASAFGIAVPSVYEWLEKGSVPRGRQWQAEILTKGKFKAARPESNGVAGGAVA